MKSCVMHGIFQPMKFEKFRISRNLIGRFAYKETTTGQYFLLCIGF